ncbi:MAG: radical SAM protein [Candidatus Asgardarchaeum californiense]|nr:MAG: radical SAM protein [Candidatus Asgardarchaeum californiense]
MEINQIHCKTALSHSALPGLDYSLNPYRGCQHGCVYCYVPNILRIHRNLWGNFVDVKSNIPNILSKELKNKKRGIVGISTVTDPYQPIEKKYKLTRYCLEQLLRYDFPICIQTKSSLVSRDFEIISKFSDAEIMISIATFDDNARQLLEPNSSSIDDRLKVLKECSRRGIKSSVFFGPIYPTITKDDIPQILDTFIEYNVSEIMIDDLNLKPGIWDNIKRHISGHEIYRSFLKNIFENKDYYNQIRKEFLRIGKEKSVRIIDAFK